MADKVSDKRGPKVVELIGESVETGGRIAETKKNGDQALDRRNEPIGQRNGVTNGVVAKHVFGSAGKGGSGFGRNITMPSLVSTL